MFFYQQNIKYTEYLRLEKEGIVIREEIIKSVIKDIKKIISKKGVILDTNKEKNKAFLKRNGLNLSHIEEAIFQLSPKELYKGPEDDRNGYSGYVYFFKTKYFTDEVIYIKIRYNPPHEVVCISFHEDEYVNLNTNSIKGRRLL